MQGKVIEPSHKTSFYQSGLSQSRVASQKGRQCHNYLISTKVNFAKHKSSGLKNIINAFALTLAKILVSLTASLLKP